MKKKQIIQRRSSLLIKHIGTIFFLISLYLFPGKGIAQSQTFFKSKIPDEKIDLMPPVNNRNIIQNNFELLSGYQNPQNLKGCSLNSAKPDSAIEYNNYGLFSEIIKWHFTYYDNSNLLNKSCSYYNLKGSFELITEQWTYNIDGQISSYIKHMPSPPAITLYFDSTFYDLISEKYTYENGNLVYYESSDSTYAYSGGYSYENKSYGYNEKNQMVTSNTYTATKQDSYISENYKTKNYSYTDNNEIKYIISPQSGTGYFLVFGDNNDTLYYSPYTIDTTSLIVNKYEYENFGSVKQTKYNIIYIENVLNRKLLDTITVWDKTEYYKETLDENGRRKTLLVTHKSSGDEEGIDYFAEYFYTETDQLLLANFYSWEESSDSCYWAIATIIENTYDEDGKILTHENKYYNALSDSWDVHEKTTYYYSENKSVETTGNGAAEKFGIYPNPATNCLKLSGTTGVKINYTIHNSIGIRFLYGTTNNGAIDINSLEKGIYFISFEENNTRQVAKFIKN